MQFLSDAAKLVFESHTLASLKDVIIVLPTRRASFFFKKELSKFSEKPFISPLVYSIDDFIIHFSGITKAEQIDLLLILFNCFKKIDKDLIFNDFIHWAPTVLKDFDLIDQSLYKNPEELFQYMSEVKALERWNLDELPPENSEATRRYFGFHSNLLKVYKSFTSQLKKEKIGSTGIIYRHLAENVESLLLENKSILKYYFIGLNSLSPSEEKIVETLINSKKAICIWDSDNYYMNQNKKAGEVLREYKSSGKYSPWKIQGDYLLKSNLVIDIIGVNSDVFQARVLNSILEKNEYKNTVIIVLDEDIVQAILIDGIPNTVSDFNITMGLGLKNSVESTFFNAYLTLYEEFNVKGRISINSFLKFLNQPIFKFFNTEIISNLRSKINKENYHYLSSKEIENLSKNHHFFKLIFSDFKNDIKGFINNCINIHNLIKEAILLSKNSVEIEFCSIFERILVRLDDLYKQYDLSIDSFSVLLNEQIKSVKVPFSGRPVSDLQIMSMLESRCLDFEHVIILNFNEGNLPAPKRLQSFMPLDLLISENLPYYSNQEAIMSYHFFRLLQRAKKASFFYLTKSKSGVGGLMEKSRFILQVEEELKEYNPAITINYPQIVFNQGLSLPSSEIIIEKDEKVISDLKKYLSESKGLSASSLENLIECELRFYWQNIKKIRSNEKSAENFESNDIGNILHKSFEILDQYLIENKMFFNSSSAKLLESKVDYTVDKLLNDEYYGYDFNFGLNKILIDQTKKLMKRFYQVQIKKGLDYEVLSCETSFIASTNLNIHGDDLLVNLNGKIDRIELRNNNTLVVLSDYKTGKVEPKNLTLNSKTGNFLDKDKKYFRQLSIYQYLFMFGKTEKETNLDLEVLRKKIIQSKIYSFRNFDEELNLVINQDESSKELLEDGLKVLLTELLDLNKPIKQTENLSNCKYCDFLSVCQRRASIF